MQGSKIALCLLQERPCKGNWCITIDFDCPFISEFSVLSHVEDQEALRSADVKVSDR